jgi:hypothetical protein
MKRSVVDITIPVELFHNEDASRAEIKETALNAIEESLESKDLLESAGIEEDDLVEAILVESAHPDIDHEMFGRDIPKKGPQDVRARPVRLTGKNAEKARKDPMRVVAYYRQQEWRGVDEDICHHLGTDFYDVTEIIENMDRLEVEGLMDNHESTDRLIHPYTQHEGPHSVDVTAQIDEYWRATREEPLWE